MAAPSSMKAHEASPPQRQPQSGPETARPDLRRQAGPLRQRRRRRADAAGPEGGAFPRVPRRRRRTPAGRALQRGVISGGAISGGAISLAAHAAENAPGAQLHGPNAPGRRCRSALPGRAGAPAQAPSRGRASVTGAASPFRMSCPDPDHAAMPSRIRMERRSVSSSHRDPAGRWQPGMARGMRSPISRGTGSVRWRSRRSPGRPCARDSRHEPSA